MINIVVLILVIIILYVIFYVKREMYTDTDINKIVKNMYNVGDKKALTNILNSVDQSNTKFKDKNILSSSKINLEDPLLDLYLDQKIIADIGDVNAKGNFGGSDKLPFIENDNYEKHNHKLRMLINSKKTKQDFIIGIIKNRINFLKGSLQNIEDIEEKYNND